MWLTFLLLMARATGALFIFSGVSKLLARHTFLAALHTLPFVPTWSVAPLVRVLPWVEVALGSAVVMGLLAPYAAGAVLALLVVFSLVAVVAVARGLDVPCSCFGEASQTPLSLRTVGRNVILALLLFPLLLINYPSPDSLDVLLANSGRSLADMLLIVSLPVCVAGVSVLIATAQRTLAGVSAR